VCYLGKVKLILPRKWLKYSMMASVCFTANGVVMVSVMKRVGLYSAMYYPFGGLGLALVFAMYYKGIHTKVIVDDEDLEDEYTCSYKDFLVLICYGLLYFLIQNLTLASIFYADQTGLNIGFIVSLWALSPLFMAIGDYYINHYHTHLYHCLCLICILICILCSGLSEIIYPKSSSSFKSDYIFIPILLGLFTPLCFSAHSMLTIHMTSLKVGFNPTVLSFTVTAAVSAAVTAAALALWLL
jgi:hypothetical protein